MNDADKTTKAAKSAEDIKLEESLAEFAKLTDPRQRKMFYDAHPELQRVYSAANFHST